MKKQHTHEITADVGVGSTGGSAVCFSRDEAAGLAIRVEDAMRVTTSLLDGADAMTAPEDWKRKTLIIMARDRNRHLEYVALRLRGGDLHNSHGQPRREDGR